MTKSTDKSLIEDTEIVPEDLAKGLVEDEEAVEVADLDDDDSDAEATVAADDDDGGGE